MYGSTPGFLVHVPPELNLFAGTPVLSEESDEVLFFLPLECGLTSRLFSPHVNFGVVKLSHYLVESSEKDDYRLSGTHSRALPSKLRFMS